jgi:hypothetical protein
MADYWGVKRIGQRMGVCESTIRAWHRSKGFLMYKRTRQYLKPSWYTNDQLVHTWELSRCLSDRLAEDARRAERKNRVAT